MLGTNSNSKLAYKLLAEKKSSKCFIVSNLTQRSNCLSKHRNFSSNPFFIPFDQHIQNKMHRVKLINIYSYSKTKTAWFSCSPVICLSAEYPTSYQVCWALRFLCLFSGKCKCYNNWTQSHCCYVLCKKKKKKVATKTCCRIFRYTGEKRFLCDFFTIPMPDFIASTMASGTRNP